MTTVAIHQPNFLPYPGFFRKLALADILVLYDTAQFVRREYQNRTRIKGPGGPRWLTIPVKVRGFPIIRQVEVDEDQLWRQRLQTTIHGCYSRAPFYDWLAPQLYPALAIPEASRLSEFCANLIRTIRETLGLDTEIRMASDLPELESNNPTGKLVEMTRRLGGDTYLSGSGGLGYMDLSEFTNVRLQVVEWSPKPYPQLWGDFVPNLSIIDMLFNCGPSSKGMLLGSTPP